MARPHLPILQRPQRAEHTHQGRAGQGTTPGPAWTGRAPTGGGSGFCALSTVGCPFARPGLSVSVSVARSNPLQPGSVHGPRATGLHVPAPSGHSRPSLGYRTLRTALRDTTCPCTPPPPLPPFHLSHTRAGNAALHCTLHPFFPSRSMSHVPCPMPHAPCRLPCPLSASSLLLGYPLRAIESGPARAAPVAGKLPDSLPPA